MCTRIQLSLLIAVVVLAFAGCGGSADGPTDPTSPEDGSGGATAQQPAESDRGKHPRLTQVEPGHRQARVNGEGSSSAAGATQGHSDPAGSKKPAGKVGDDAPRGAALDRLTGLTRGDETGGGSGGGRVIDPGELKSVLREMEKQAREREHAGAPNPVEAALDQVLGEREG